MAVVRGTMVGLSGHSAPKRSKRKDRRGLLISLLRREVGKIVAMYGAEERPPASQLAASQYRTLPSSRGKAALSQEQDVFVHCSHQ